MALQPRTQWIGLALCTALCACESQASSRPLPSCAQGQVASCQDAQPPAEIAAAVQSLAFCSRPGADKVRDVFCQPSEPGIESLRALQAALGINPARQGYEIKKPGELAVTRDNYQVSFVVALSHSTSLSGHVVSALNPRVFFLTQEAILAYSRGVQRVELAVAARDRKGFNFYLIEFEQACNAAEGGCGPGDLFTPRVESDWQRVVVRDDEDLKNTALDCRQCHARGRPQMQLLMRELEKPWAHFFLPYTDPPSEILEPGVSGVQLAHDYVDAKGDEPYGGATEFVMRHCNPAALEGASGSDQPLRFDSETIQRERWPEGLRSTNTEPFPSPTWEHGYEAFKRGEQLALPYVEPRTADVDKQTALIEAYARYRKGELSAEELPNLADIFPDDPQLRARIGLQTEPDAEPVDALIQACAGCHNDKLDQSLTRARFNVDVSKLDAGVLELATARIQLPKDNPLVMPPPEARQLDHGTRDKLLSFLRDRQATAQGDIRLERAAEVGGVGHGE